MGIIPLRPSYSGRRVRRQPLRSIRILGVRVDDVTYDDVLEMVADFIRSGGPHVVVTPNPEIVMLGREDARLAALFNRADLAIPDGVGLLAAAALGGRPLREHVRGTDLVHRLAARSEETGWRWFLLGAEAGVAVAAAEALRRMYPRLLVAGTHSGSPEERDDQAVRTAIRAAGTVEIILVAYGAGQQERWMERNLGPLSIPVGIGVGGVLNFLSGRVPRAPAWMRAMELEFLHRLLVQPWRLRRQLALPAFACLATAEALRLRIAGPSGEDL